MRWLREPMSRSAVPAWRWLSRHLDAVLILATCVLMMAGVLALGRHQDMRRGESDVRACERGNVVRAYLAFDNAEAISVLRASLQAPQDESTRERRAREQSLERRIAEQAELVPFDCDSLR